MSKPKLSDELHAAYDWIDAAGEWKEAIADPGKYAREAAANAQQNDAGSDVNESTLAGAIEYFRLYDAPAT